jgi:hypothetical protein
VVVYHVSEEYSASIVKVGVSSKYIIINGIIRGHKCTTQTPLHWQSNRSMNSGNDFFYERFVVTSDRLDYTVRGQIQYFMFNSGNPNFKPIQYEGRYGMLRQIARTHLCTAKEFKCVNHWSCYQFVNKGLTPVNYIFFLVLVFGGTCIDIWMYAYRYFDAGVSRVESYIFCADNKGLG